MYTTYTFTDKLKRIDELREKWKKEEDPIMKRIIVHQANLIKKTLPKKMYDK